MYISILKNGFAISNFVALHNSKQKFIIDWGYFGFVDLFKKIRIELRKKLSFFYILLAKLD